jgi:hypothetical protein
VLLVAAGIVALGSCFVDGFELVDGVGGGGSPASGGAAGSGGGGGGVCGHVRWPSRPEGGADPGGSIEVVVAIRTLDFGEDVEAAQAPGYDLDGFCTCEINQGPGCRIPDHLTTETCDGQDGQDNALAALFDVASTFTDALDSSFHNRRIETGDYTTLLEVSGYNGEPLDAVVSAAIYPSPGLTRDPCNPGDVVAQWDGSDRWPVIAEAVMGAAGQGGSGGGGGGEGGASCGPSAVGVDNAMYVDEAAYVVDGVLVASFADAQIAFFQDGYAAGVRATGVVVTGQLVPAGSAWAIDNGVLAGRIEHNNLVLGMSALMTEGGTVCPDDPLFDPIKTASCGAIDIGAALAGPTTPCGATSFGILFEAEPAQLGSIYLPPTPVPCDEDPTLVMCE